MALIKCPECGREISDKAQFCPNCGFPLNLERPQPYSEPKSDIIHHEEKEDVATEGVPANAEVEGSAIEEVATEADMPTTSEEDDKKPLPPLLKFILIMVAIAGVIGIAKQVLETQNRQAASQISKEVRDYLTGQSSSSAGVKRIRHKGLSIQIPSDWTHETSKEDGGAVHQLMMMSPDMNDISSILWGKSMSSLNPLEAAQNMRENGRRNYDKFSSTRITKISFCGQETYTFDFSYEEDGTPVNARALYFIMNGYGVAINNISAYKSHLSSNRFDFIEETLTIN